MAAALARSRVGRVLVAFLGCALFCAWLLGTYFVGQARLDGPRHSSQTSNSQDQQP